MSGMGEGRLVVSTLRDVLIAAAVVAAVSLSPRLAAAQTPTQPPPPPAPMPAPPPPPAPAPPPSSGMQFGFFPLPVNNTPGQIVDEVKAGVLAHDIGFLTHHVEHGVDMNIEMLFTPPDLLSIIGSPRPHIGGDINLEGNTSDAYAGLTWGISLIQNLFHPGDSVFVTGSLGGAYQDGFIDNAPPERKKLGSPILFRESAELGYQITPTISISAILDHISNANLAQHNGGITSAGARFGFKF
jgi:lipid A 3-O-deacylase